MDDDGQTGRDDNTKDGDFPNSQGETSGQEQSSEESPNKPHGQEQSSGESFTNAERGDEGENVENPNKETSGVTSETDEHIESLEWHDEATSSDFVTEQEIRSSSRKRKRGNSPPNESRVKRSILDDLPEVPESIRQPDTPLAQNRSTNAPLTTAPRRKKQKETLAKRYSPPQARTKKTERFDKFFRPDPFPKDLPDNQKLAAWKRWKRLFNNALAVARPMSEFSKANHLCIAVGHEVGEIIATHGMMPERNEVESDFPFFENLLERLDAHFMDTFDQQANMGILNDMTQKEGEAARDFYQRILSQASVTLTNPTGEDATKMIRNILLKGLLDREWAKMAFNLDLDAKRIVQAASRSLLPARPEHNLVEVHNVTTRQPGPSRSGTEPRKQKEPTRFSDRRSRPQGTKQNQREILDKPCGKCGRRSHRAPGDCPANGKTCNKCGGTNHFAAVCNSQPASVNELTAKPSEVIIMDGTGE